MNNFYDDISTLYDKDPQEILDNDNICLISQERLTEDCIILECNHKFNYISIYDEIVKQKTIKNKYETQQLKTNQIKCPYCRNVQNKLLPYLDDKKDKFPKIYGVNSPIKYCMLKNKCQHILLSGKRKGEKCLISSTNNKCKRHSKIILKNKCQHILLSGKRKGEKCLIRCLDDKCKRHSKI